MKNGFTKPIAATFRYLALHLFYIKRNSLQIWAASLIRIETNNKEAALIGCSPWEKSNI